MGSLGHWPTPGSTRHLASAPGRSRSGCSTTATAAPTAPVVGGQSVPPNANGQGSNRRSDDGQTIFTGNRMAQERGPDLVFLVELSGLEPLTSCMPCWPISSARVAAGPVPARQATCGVWLGPAPLQGSGCVVTGFPGLTKEVWLTARWADLGTYGHDQSSGPVRRPPRWPIRRRARPDVCPITSWLAEWTCPGSGSPMPGIDLPSSGASRLKAACQSREISAGMTNRQHR